MLEPILLTTAQISTFAGERALSNASGFFFRRNGNLFLVTSRHVLIDEPSGHRPDRIAIELHIDAGNLARASSFQVPLYRNGVGVWRQGMDAAGGVDVAVVPLDPAVLPGGMVFRAFTPAHLPGGSDVVEVGASVLVVGFPLGFHDTLHHLPVARHAVIASAFGLRFQGSGYFLTDGRTHRGTSGAPVVLRSPTPPTAGRRELPWLLLGVHSARIDVGTRDYQLDESLGLNCAWYADILLTLTREGSS
jgi:hypothetical protein